MSFYCLDVRGIRVFRPLGEKLDAGVSARFKSQIIDSYSGGANAIVVDMSAIKELDISGVAAILSASRAAGSKGQFVLSGLSKSVKRYLELTNMSSSFVIFGSPEEAVRELSHQEMPMAANA